MTALTTSTSAYAWRPDETFFAPTDVVPEALILQTSTVAGHVDGDQPAVRVAYVTDDEAGFFAESETITESDPVLAERVITTGKIAQLVRLSNEQYRQANTAAQLAQSVSRAITKKADEEYVAGTSPLTGLLNIAGTVNGGQVAADLDGLVDLIAQLESNGATPTHIVLDPLGWASLRKLKIGDDYNQSLLGAGTTDAAPLLLGLPVIVNRDADPFSGLVLDRSAVVSAVGPVMIATSEHAAFAADGVLLRATWRIGWNIVRPNRIGKFTMEPGT